MMVIRDKLGVVLSEGSDLEEADLHGADLHGANLGWADSVIDAGYPNGFRCVAWFNEGHVMLRVGCRDKTLEESFTYWGPTHKESENRQEILKALEYIAGVSKIRGWV